MDRKTVFVIGAGASKEAKLPTGDELKEHISRLLDFRFDWDRLKSGDSDIYRSIKEIVKSEDGRPGDVNPYIKEARHIRDALPMAISIDNFIDSQRGNEKLAICGKLSIARSILEAEKGSLLYFKRERVDSTIRFQDLSASWYLPFFQILTENCSVDDLGDRFESVVLIVFNYDRCIEHFLFHALQSYYRISEEEATEIIDKIEIYHPYGFVGTLPWQRKPDPTGFGEDSTPKKLIEISNKIKTFTEGTDPESSEVVAIRHNIGGAHRLVFLGFAFHKLNMEVLKPDLKPTEIPRVRCYATTLNISDSDKEVIKYQINGLFEMESRPTEIHPFMANLTCNAFFSEFWRSLSF